MSRFKGKVQRLERELRCREGDGPMHIVAEINYEKGTWQYKGKTYKSEEDLMRKNGLKPGFCAVIDQHDAMV